MAKKDDDKKDDEGGPVTFRHVRDGREVTVQSNYTNQIDEYEDHPNWERA